MFGGESEAIGDETDSLLSFVESPMASEQVPWFSGATTPVFATGQPNFGPFQNPMTDDDEGLYAPSQQQQINSSFCTRLLPSTREDPVTGTEFFSTGSCTHIDPFFAPNNREPLLVMFGTEHVVQNARCAVSSALAGGYTVFHLRAPMPLWFYTNNQYIMDILGQAARAAPSVIFVADDPVLTLNTASGRVSPSMTYYKGYPLRDGAAIRALSGFVTERANEMKRNSAMSKRVKLVVTTSSGPDMLNTTLLKLTTLCATVAIYPTFIRRKDAMRCIVTRYMHIHHDLTFPQDSDTQAELDDLWNALWECVYYTTVDWFVAFLRRATMMLQNTETGHRGNAAALYTARNLLRTVRTRSIMIREGGATGRITGHKTLMHGYIPICAANASCTRFFADLTRNDDRFPRFFQAQEEPLVSTAPVLVTALPLAAQVLSQRQVQAVAQDNRRTPPARASSSLQLVTSAPDLRQPAPPPVVDEIEEGEMTGGEIRRAEAREYETTQAIREAERTARRMEAERNRLSFSIEIETDRLISQFDRRHLEPHRPQFSTEQLVLLDKYNPLVKKMVMDGACPFPSNQMEYESTLTLAQEHAEKHRVAQQSAPPPPVEREQPDLSCSTSPRAIVPAPSPKRVEPTPVSQKTKQPIPSSLFGPSSAKTRPKKHKVPRMVQFATVFGDAKKPVKEPVAPVNTAKRKMRGLLRMGIRIAPIAPTIDD